MAIRGSPVVKDVYLDDNGDEYLPGEETQPGVKLSAGVGDTYLDDQGNDIPAPQIKLPGRSGGRKNFGDPKELLAAHQANLLAQPQPQKIIDDKSGRRVADIAPSPIDLGMEVLGAPVRAVKALGDLPEFGKSVYKAATGPEPLKNLGDIAYGAADAAVDTGRKALGIYATPKEQAGALGDVATMALAPKAIGGVARRTASAARELTPARRALAAGSEARSQGINQLVSALHPNSRTARSLETAIPEIVGGTAENETAGYLVRNPHRVQAVAGPSGSLEGFASVSRDTLDDFVKTNVTPMEDMLRQAPEFSKLLDRRAELNAKLGKIGYFDNHPLLKKLAASAPGVEDAVNELDATRKAIDGAIDTMAPRNVSTAAVMRKYSDLKQISDVSSIKSERWNLTKAEAAGNATPMRKYIQEAVEMLGAGVIGTSLVGPAGGAAALLRPATLFRISRAIKYGMQKPKIDPDILVRRAFKNFERGKGTIAEPRPIEARPIQLPGEEVRPPQKLLSGQTSEEWSNAPAPGEPPDITPSEMELSPGQIPRTNIGYPRPSPIALPKPRVRARAVPVEPQTQPPANPYAGPERRRSILTPEEAAEAQITRMANRRRASDPLAGFTEGSYYRVTGEDSRLGDFVDTMDRTKKGGSPK